MSPFNQASIATERRDSTMPGQTELAAGTIPALFLERCRRTPSRVAYRVKKLGIYQEVNWQQYLTDVENLCLGLIELGLERGDRVAIMGEACPEWLYADLAAQSAGGISYGIYPTSSIPELQYLMENAGARFFVAQNQEYVDKLLQIVDQLPQLRNIIVVDASAMFLYEDSRILTMAQVMELGARSKERRPQFFSELVAQLQTQDVATIIYTSGTTGPAKGAMVSHEMMLFNAKCLTETFEALSDSLGRVVSYLPMVHAFGRGMDGYYPMRTGYVVHYGEEAAQMQQTLFEVSPTVFVGAPRTYEKLAAQVLVGIETSSWLKKRAYHWAMRVGRRYIEQRWCGQVSLINALFYRLAYLTVFRPILDKLGFMRVKLGIVSAAAVPPSVVALWQIWGVNVLEAYGQTEAGFTCAQRGPFPRPGNAGLPFSGVEIKLTEENELLVRQRGQFTGYWQNPEATAQVKQDGWVTTGDIVSIDEAGNLKVVDRKKDILVTAGGKNITPSEIEKALKASPYISEVVVFGDGRKFPAALVEIDFDTVSEWARTRGIIYTSFTSLSQHREVVKLIAGEVERGNGELAKVEQVKKFRIIPKELDPEDENDPVTPTRKVQRRQMYERYKDLVESMYSSQEEALIRAEIRELAEGPS